MSCRIGRGALLRTNAAASPPILTAPRKNLRMMNTTTVGENMILRAMRPCSQMAIRTVVFLPNLENTSLFISLLLHR